MMPPTAGAAAAAAPRQLDANQINNLNQQGFTSGIMQAIALNSHRFPLRLWVIDNSSSMQECDAHVIRGSTLQKLSSLNCSRWQEAQESVMYFCHMATTLNIPTRFVMLNDLGRMFCPPTFSIGEQGPATLARDFKNAHSIMGRAYPSGATPLTKHVKKIRSLVASMAPQLRQRGQMVSVILATDGLPSDKSGNEGHVILSQFVDALRSLEGLPVWVVVRLCTDDDKVFDFYNSIDAQLNLPYDVLDDFYGEALEVYLHNPWLTYALPLHRFRELGFFFPVLDALDEHALAFLELKNLCSILFQHGCSLPDPALDWLAFLRALANLLARERWQFNSVSQTLCPWIDLRRLHLVYGQNLPFPPELQQHSSMQQPQAFAPTQEYPTLQQTAGGSNYPQQQPQQHRAPSTIPRQQQPRPQPQTPPPPSRPGPPTSKYQNAQVSSDLSALKTGILRWAVLGPNVKPIDQIVASIHQTFPPAFGLAPHAYFKKWQPFSQDALSQRTKAVIKRAVRKLKFFLHPDKLPRDFSNTHNFLCKLLWDISADSLEEYEKHEGV